MAPTAPSSSRASASCSSARSRWRCSGSSHPLDGCSFSARREGGHQPSVHGTSAPSASRTRVPGTVSILLGVAVAATLAHSLYTVLGLGKPGLSDFFDRWVYDGALVLGSI